MLILLSRQPYASSWSSQMNRCNNIMKRVARSLLGLTMVITIQGGIIVIQSAIVISDYRRPFEVQSLLGIPYARADQSGDKLPYPAGQCVNSAKVLIDKGKIAEAIALLESFNKKGRESSKEIQLKNGYNHYYIDYMLGNAFMMLAEQKQNGSGKSRNSLTKGNSGSTVGKNSAFDEHSYRSAASYYQQSIDKKQDQAEAWINLAGCRYQLGQMHKAADAFVRGYELSTKKSCKASHLYYGAVCYFQCGDKNSLQKAKKAFGKLFGKHSDEIKTEWVESYVNTLFALNDYKTALPYIKRLVASNRGSIKRQWQEILLYQYMNLNMDQDALLSAKNLVSSNPLESKWWKVLAHIHCKRDNLRQGLQAMVIYSFLEPLTREESALIADLYLALDIPSKAAIYYEDLLKEKFDRNIAMRLVQAYQVYQPDKAIKWIDKLIGGDEKMDKTLVERKKMLESKLFRCKGDNPVNG